jgi:phosphate butyryltransferase
MISSFTRLLEQQKARTPTVTVAIAMADEEEVRLARQASEKGLANFVLIGVPRRIEALMEDQGMAKDAHPIVECLDEKKAAAMAIRMVRDGQADLPMKGLMQTGNFMRAILDKADGIPTRRRISQITVFAGSTGRLQFLTDCAINVAPNLAIKKDIIENAVEVAQVLGYRCPRVALIGAVETVSEAMPDTIDSAVLTQMNRRGQIANCIIDGPLSLDNAISENAAKLKGIDSPVRGAADILVASSLQEANTFSKALHYYAHLPTASVIAGAKAPFIMTSRTDEIENKIHSIAISCYLHSAGLGS